MKESLPGIARQLTETAQALLRCNGETEHFGLSLSEPERQSLALRRAEALRRSGRMEFGEGILPSLIRAFCDSPYLHQQDYAQTLETLQELFYELKSESGERLSDELLLAAMRRAYDGPAGGVAEAIPDVGVLELCRCARLGRRPEATDARKESEDEPFT